MDFDAKRVPLSARGSYLCFSIREEQPVLLAVDERENPNTLFTLETARDTAILVHEDSIAFRGANVDVCCAFYDQSFLLLRGTKPLRLHYAYQCRYVAHTAVFEDGKLRIGDAKTGSQLWFQARQGSLRLYADWQSGRIHSGEVTVEIQPENGVFEVVFLKTKSLDSAEFTLPSFAACCAARRADFSDWCAQMHADTDFRREMAFVLWQNAVAPRGNYKYETILCAKASMNAIWSWDHCFHALGVAAAFPQMAFDQFMAIFEYMDESGALPDTVTPYAVNFAFTKPPVHAFIYEILMERHPFFSEITQIRRIYPYLCKNFRWWTTKRKNAPVYWHGNDSGADNSTCFDRYPVIQSPDLYAKLSFTAVLLSRFAKILGDLQAAADYRRQAEWLGRETERRFFDGERFFVRPMDEAQTPYYCDSLLPLHALIAGEFLSESCVEKTVKRLETAHLGDYGLTSEAFDSPKHIDGMWEAYWRGSVWSCEQVLLARALQKLGNCALADKILQNYRRALQIGGAAENTHSLTGTGNCAAGYSWAAAAEFFIQP